MSDFTQSLTFGPDVCRTETDLTKYTEFSFDRHLFPDSCSLKQPEVKVKYITGFGLNIAFV